jgi:hypothetical protein
MRTLLLLIPLALVGCKPDPIEACVEAERKASRQELDEICKRLKEETGKDDCSEEKLNKATILLEPDWRKSCMMAAAGKK